MSYPPARARYRGGLSDGRYRRRDILQPLGILPLEIRSTQLTSDIRPTGKNAHVSVRDHDRDLGSDICRLLLSPRMDPGLAAPANSFDRNGCRPIPEP
jgi:hypothetical protein